MRRTIASRFGVLVTDSGRRFPRKAKLLVAKSQKPVTLEAIKAIVKKADDHDVTEHLPFLIRALDHEDWEIGTGALNALWNGSYNGTDISSALSKLIEIIDDPKMERRHMNASFALGRLAKTMDLSYLVPKYAAVVAENADIMSYSACNVIAKLAEGGTDISSSLPTLWDALKIERLIDSAAGAFFHAAMNTDISLYVPDLIEVIKTPRYGISNCYFALTRAGNRGADIRAAVPYLIAGLGSKANSDGVIISALYEAAKQGADVSAALPDVERIAADSDAFAALEAKELLKYLREGQSAQT